MNLDELISNIATEYADKFDEDFRKVANEVNDIYFKEVNKIYDSFIEQYYSYKTKFYIRHWEGAPGTGTGSNLYYGNQMKIHRGQDPYFEVIYDGSEMADDYQYDSADTVLQNVAFGIRGVPPYWVESWSGKYKSRYFNFSGSLMEAYDYFLSHYEEMMTPVFMRRWKKLGWN